MEARRCGYVFCEEGFVIDNIMYILRLIAFGVVVSRLQTL